jgi:hypothetical protein
MRRTYILLLFIVALAISSCRSQQGRLTTNLSTEWNIDRYEIRSVDGQNVIIENAGTIELNEDGTGIQRFTANIANHSNDNEAEFQWHNTSRTVYIQPSDEDTPKVWIVVNSRRTQQVWYSTDDDANVQILEISRR